MVVSGTYYNPFQGLFTHSGAWGGLRSHILTKNWPFLTPPANPVQFFWLKMPSKCVPWIVLQVSPSTRTSRGSLRPPKRPSKAKNGQNITFLDISGSVLSDFANFPASPLKREKNAAFGSHVALSVLQIDLWIQGKSSSVHHYESGRNSSLFSLPCFLFYFLGDFWSETTQGTSMGRARIHFRGSWPIQGPFQPKKLDRVGRGGQKRSKQVRIWLLAHPMENTRVW